MREMYNSIEHWKYNIRSLECEIEDIDNQLYALKEEKEEKKMDLKECKMILKKLKKEIKDSDD